MSANDGVGGVGVGLGKNKDKPKCIAGPGTTPTTGPGTATLHFTSQDMGTLMAAHGQFLESLVADYPIDPRELAAAAINNPLPVTKGWTRVTFSNARIQSVKVAGGGAVEVGVHYLGASSSPLASGWGGGGTGEVQPLNASAKPKQTGSGDSSGNVAAKWNIAQGTAA